MTSIKLIACKYCGNLIRPCNITKHESRHKNNPKSFKERSFKLTHEGLDCQFCGKTCKNRNSLCNHERLCKENPDRQESYLSNQGWSKGLTKETDNRVKHFSDVRKQNLMEHPNKNTGGIRVGSAKKCKYGTYRGFYCDSGWELAFLVYHLDHNITIERNGDYFEYIYTNKTHKYYPDFIIGDTYYEIKGIYRENDQAKIDQFPESKKLIVIDSKHINTYVKYCEHKYGKDYAKILYDRNYPCWLDNIGKVNKNYNFKPID